MLSPPADRVLRTVAPAKINWTLEVLGRRDDGYHEIRSVIQTISLCDELSVWTSATTTLHIEGGAPEDLRESENLVARAARCFPDRLALGLGLSLRKAIPEAAGLGGGSSDAAATLRLLEEHWRLADAGAVERAARSLGSDVPFFLRGGLQVASGRGETLRPLPIGAPVRLLLATPPIALPDKTARLYAALRPAEFSDGSRTAALVARLEAGRPPRAEDYVNVFDRAAEREFPDLVGYKRRFERVTGAAPLLAGAGPTLFALYSNCRSRSDERELLAVLSREGFAAWLVETTGPIPAPGRGV